MASASRPGPRSGPGGGGAEPLSGWLTSVPGLGQGLMRHRGPSRWHIRVPVSIRAPGNFGGGHWAHRQKNGRWQIRLGQGLMQNRGPSGGKNRVQAHRINGDDPAPTSRPGTVRLGQGLAYKRVGPGWGGGISIWCRGGCSSGVPAGGSRGSSPPSVGPGLATGPGNLGGVHYAGRLKLI